MACNTGGDGLKDETSEVYGVRVLGFRMDPPQVVL